MKAYKFDLKHKTESLITHRNECAFDFSEYREFNQHILGLKRNWIPLKTHNDIEYVKRLLIPESKIMLSNMYSKYGSTKDYLIYIDFGKYDFNKNILNFIDLELDILITKDLKFEILDMDELLYAFKNNRINEIELSSILIFMQKFINSLVKNGIFETLNEHFAEEAIEWLVN
jgi:hypothetical protein